MKKKQLFTNDEEIDRLCLLNLRSITKNANIGKLISKKLIFPTIMEVTYSCLQNGYKDWLWTISLSQIDTMSDITVNEVNLIPKKNALLPKNNSITKNKIHRKHYCTEKLLINDNDTYFFK